MAEQKLTLPPVLLKAVRRISQPGPEGDALRLLGSPWSKLRAWLLLPQNVTHSVTILAERLGVDHTVLYPYARAAYRPKVLPRALRAAQDRLNARRRTHRQPAVALYDWLLLSENSVRSVPSLAKELGVHHNTLRYALPALELRIACPAGPYRQMLVPVD